MRVLKNVAKWRCLLLSSSSERFESITSESSHHDDPYPSLTDLRATRYVILQAFSRHVWYSLFAILALISFLLHAVLRREEAVVHAGSEAPPWETSEVLLATIGAICQQGSHRHPDTAAARTIFMCLFVLSVIIYTAFSAAFVALLSPPIHNQHHAEVLTHLKNHRTQFMEKFPFEYMASVLLKSSVSICTNKHKPHKPSHNCSIVIQIQGNKSMMDAFRHMAVSDKLLLEDNQLAFDEDKLTKTFSLTMKDAYPAFFLLLSGTIMALVLLIIEIMRHQQNLGHAFKLRSNKTSRKSAKFSSRTRFIH